MIQVERHFCKGNAEIIRLCQTSKELYNRCTFLMRKSWFEHVFPMPDINTLIATTKDLDCFKQLHNTKTAKQTVRKVLTDWTNFRKAWNAYKKDSSKFISRPKPPNYKQKMAQVIFYNETIKKKPSRKGIIVPTNDCFSIPCTKTYKQVVITPKTFGFVIEVQYDTDEQASSKQSSLPAKKLDKPKLSKDKICCIDIGLNTLAAITSDQLYHNLSLLVKSQ